MVKFTGTLVAVGNCYVPNAVVFPVADIEMTLAAPWFIWTSELCKWQRLLLGSLSALHEFRVKLPLNWLACVVEKAIIATPKINSMGQIPY